MTSFKGKGIKAYMPNIIIRYIRTLLVEAELIKTFWYDYIRFRNHSAYNGFNNKIKLEATIVRSYHVIEKGLTMPEIRLGFGYPKVIDLCDFCEKYIKHYDGINSIQLIHALEVLKEYQEYHKEMNYALSAKIEKKISNLLLLANNNVVILGNKQKTTTKEEYFKEKDSPFFHFSNSRRSIRNYSNKEIPEQIVREALGLALNAPSACNRQAARMYVVSDKKKIVEILKLQNGAGGFGELSNRLIIITSELGVFNSPRERNQAFIDGGIFAMNVLYSLHAYSIVGCILNCNFKPRINKKVLELCKIPSNEVFVSMITCGFPPDKFSVATSLRYPLDERCKFI